MAIQNSNNTVYLHNINTYSPSSGGTATLDLSKGACHHITMPAGNITIAISNAQVGQFFQVRILQDATGNRTVTWFSTIKWASRIVPTLTIYGGYIDEFIFQVTGSNTYDGFIVGQGL